MDIKSFLPGKEKKEKEKYYWALLIEPDWVQAGIWSIVDGKAKVVSSSPPAAWKLEEELIQATDAALSSSVQNLSEDVKEPSKTVFGVISSWVEEGEIKQEYLEIIKKVCSNLSLEPVGFVVLSEAISHLIKKEEGSPLSAVVLGVSEQNIELSIFKLGNLIGTSQVARSVSVVDDVAEGLARFSDGEPMPSRFLLYNGKEGDLEEVRQSLVKGNWEDFEKIKFLHPPKIETIIPEKKVSAVVLAGASEIADVSVLADDDKGRGFDEETEREETSNVSVDTKEISAEELGFVLGKDVMQEEEEDFPEVHQEVAVEEPLASDEPSPSVVASEQDVKKKASLFNKKPSFALLNKIKTKITGLKTRVVKKPQSRTGAGKKPFVIGAVLFIVVLLGGFLLYWYYPKATVTIYVSAQELNEKIEISVDPDLDNPNFSEKVLPGEMLTKSSSGEKTKSTTGTRTVGDKSEGEVTFYRVGPDLTLSAATTLNGPGDLKFSLNESITVASGSASSPGTTTASIAAENIGAQYNLAANSSFSVSNYSTTDVEAKNDNAFSGGSSREISAVAEEDHEDLEKELTKEIENNVAEGFVGELASNLFFIEESVSAVPSSTVFSDKIGDEASTLKLSLTLDVVAIAVEKDALTQLSREALGDKVPSGFVLRDEQIEFDFDYKEEVDGVYVLSAQVVANLLPEIDPTEVAKKITGKYPQLAKNYLTEKIPGFVRADVNFEPKLPGRLGTLPRVAKNIEVVIASEKVN